jgi:hypothetical protein
VWDEPYLSYNDAGESLYSVIVLFSGHWWAAAEAAAGAAPAPGAQPDALARQDLAWLPPALAAIGSLLLAAAAALVGPYPVPHPY